MKKIILLFLFPIALHARIMIVEKKPDSEGGTQWIVRNWVNADGSEERTIYKTIEEAQKAVSVLSNGASGLSEDSDRAIIYFKTVHHDAITDENKVVIKPAEDVEVVERAEFTVTPKAKGDAGQAVVKKETQIDAKTASDITTLDTDAKAKQQDDAAAESVVDPVK